MSKRITSLLLSMILILGSMTGCARQEVPAQTQPIPVSPQIISVSEQAQANDKTLSMDVQVDVADLNSMEEITLCFDEELLDKMVKELVHTHYPGLKEEAADGCRDWSVATEERLLFGMGCWDRGFEAGRTYYLDVARNLNGQDMYDDELKRWTPNYMTEHIPDKLEMTSEEAADQLAAFLEQYSCFQYEPWNVVAVNCNQVADSSGYYQAMMRPEYEGIPVLIDGVPYVSACLSADGVFTFQGMMVLKEQSRKPVTVTMTLEEAVEQFKEDLLTDSRDGAVTLDCIKVGYVAQSHYDETRVLSPAWIFEYSAVRPHLNTGEKTTTYYTRAYRMTDGSLFTF